MDAETTILDMFGVDLPFLTQVVRDNPSVRGIILGYLAERILRDKLATDPRVSGLRKDDDHDRSSKGDLVLTYLDHEFRIEVKSLQTNSVKMLLPGEEKWMPKIVRGRGVAGRRPWLPCETYRAAWPAARDAARYRGNVQCDASDNRTVQLPNGHSVKTTNLVVGEFDVLAVSLFAFRERWDFGFILNCDLPRTKSIKYAPEDRPYLLKTLVSVEWPLLPDCSPDPFPLFDRLIASQRRKKSASSASGKR